MSFHYLLLPVAFLNFLMGLLVWRRDWRAPVNWAFMAFQFSVGSWVLTDFFLISARNGQTAIFWEGAAHFTGICIAVSLWVLARLFSRQKVSLLTWITVALLVAAMGAGTFWPGLLADGVTLHSWGPEVHIRLLYHLIFIAVFSFFFFRGLRSLISYAKCPIHRLLARRQAKCLARGFICAGAGGIFFNIILLSPLIHQQQLVWLGPLFTIFIVLGTDYARHNYYFGVSKASSSSVLMEDLPAPFSFSKWMVGSLKKMFDGWKVKSA